MQTSNSSFFHLGIAPKMLNLLEKLKFVQPTPIQSKAIPIIIEGKDIFGVAQTGTGKTLAFGVPTVQRLMAMEKAQALIVVPTRELALQVEEALAPLLLEFGLKSAALIGGIPIHRQFKKLSRKPRVIIATPGRLIDHLQQKRVSLKETEILILDEADRMFDMGFQPQIEEILRKMKKQRQTLLFSATMPEDIVKLAMEHMKLPIRIEIAPPGTTTEQVTQEMFIVKEEKKKTLLKALLHEYRGPVLVFVRTKVGAQRVNRMIREMGYDVAEIHSDRSMGQRKQAIEGFKKGKFQILVATDVASRGIDVSNIEMVLNFDLPDDVDTYVHRIGRTGRAGSEGHAISFAKPNQGLFVAKIEKLIRKAVPISQHDELSEERFDKNSSSSGPRNRGGRRKPFGRRDDKRGFGKRDDKKPFGKRGDKKSFGKRDDKKPFGRRDDKKSFGKRDDKKPFGKRDDKKSFGKRDDKKPFGKRDDKKSFGKRDDKKSFGKRDDKKDSGKRDDKKSFGKKKKSKKKFFEKSTKKPS